MNSVLQAFFSVPEVQDRYFHSQWAQNLIGHYSQSAPPSADLSVQLAKLGTALLSDRYTEPVRTGDDGEESVVVDGDIPRLDLRVAPRMLKHIVGKGKCW